MNWQTSESNTTANIGFASCGVKGFNSSTVFQFNFSAGLTVLCPEIPPSQSVKTLKYSKKEPFKFMIFWSISTHELKINCLGKPQNL